MSTFTCISAFMNLYIYSYIFTWQIHGRELVNRDFPFLQWTRKCWSTHFYDWQPTRLTIPFNNASYFMNRRGISLFFFLLPCSMVNIFNVLFGCFISPSFSVSNASKASRWCVFRQCLYVSCSLMYSPCSELYNPLPSTSYRFSASISSLICPKLESQPLLQLYFPCLKSCHWFLSEIFAQKKNHCERMLT